jgi:hypothetical protein
MSYITVFPQKEDGAINRPFYIAEIVQTGKIEIPLEEYAKPSGLFVNILTDSDAVINSVQSKFHKKATYIPLENTGITDITEQNENYVEAYSKALKLYIPENAKTTHILLDIANLGTIGNIRVEIATNII